MPAAVTIFTAKAFIVLHNNNGLHPAVAPQEVARKALDLEIHTLFLYSGTFRFIQSFNVVAIVDIVD